MSKSADAFRTISEVAEWLDTPAHVLRFWESKFSQVKPVKRAGGRRYYRPADMALLAGLKKLLHEDGLTIKGAQKVLREQGVKYVASLVPDALDEGAGPIEEAPFQEVEPAQPEETLVEFRAPEPQPKSQNVPPEEAAPEQAAPEIRTDMEDDTQPAFDFDTPTESDPEAPAPVLDESADITAPAQAEPEDAMPSEDSAADVAQSYEIQSGEIQSGEIQSGEIQSDETLTAAEDARPSPAVDTGAQNDAPPEPEPGLDPAPDDKPLAFKPDLVSEDIPEPESEDAAPAMSQIPWTEPEPAIFAEEAAPATDDVPQEAPATPEQVAAEEPAPSQPDFAEEPQVQPEPEAPAMSEQVAVEEPAPSQPDFEAEPEVQPEPEAPAMSEQDSVEEPAPSQPDFAEEPEVQPEPKPEPQADAVPVSDAPEPLAPPLAEQGLQAEEPDLAAPEQEDLPAASELAPQGQITAEPDPEPVEISAAPDMPQPQSAAPQAPIAEPEAPGIDAQEAAQAAALLDALADRPAPAGGVLTRALELSRIDATQKEALSPLMADLAALHQKLTSAPVAPAAPSQP